jgi:hypothetical protein
MIAILYPPSSILKRFSSLLHAERQALDYHRHESLSFHHLTHIDEVQL